MTFSNPITGGQGALVRPAIKSPNYEPGAAGWTINRDGTAEFSDLVIRSSDGSGNTVTVANGRVTIRDAADTVVTEIDGGGARFYLPDGVMFAEITRAGGWDNYAGIIARSQFGDDSYAMLGNSMITFGDGQAAYAQPPRIVHGTAAGLDPSSLLLRSGEIDGVQAGLELESQAGRGVVSIRGGAGADPCDVDVYGAITAQNIRHGQAQTPAPGVSEGGTTSVAVSLRTAGGDPMSGTPRVVVTPETSVSPGDRTIRAYVDNVTPEGFTLKVYRSSNSATNVNYIAMSD